MLVIIHHIIITLQTAILARWDMPQLIALPIAKEVIAAIVMDLSVANFVMVVIVSWGGQV